MATRRKDDDEIEVEEIEVEEEPQPATDSEEAWRDQQKAAGKYAEPDS